MALFRFAIRLLLISLFVTPRRYMRRHAFAYVEMRGGEYYADCFAPIAALRAYHVLPPRADVF